jgi:hypothetical protein
VTPLQAVVEQRSCYSFVIVIVIEPVVVFGLYSYKGYLVPIG